MKLCPYCGSENNDIAGFCVNCGNSIREQNYDNNNQTMEYTSSPKTKNYGLIIGIAAILISVMIIAAFFLMPMTGSTDGDINKIEVEGGPKMNIQSLVSGGGNALTIPDLDHTAVYGYYMSNERIGKMSYTTVGDQSYNGYLCTKVIGDGAIEMSVMGYSVDVDFDFTAYASKSDDSLMHADYDFDYDMGSFGSNMGMQLSVDVDKDNNEISSSVTTDMGGFDTDAETTIKVTDDFWAVSDSFTELYVGLSEELTYTTTTNTYGYDEDKEVTMTISVTDIEDVTVKKGTYEDCYIIVIEQVMDSTTTTSTIWVTEDGFCPKMEVGSSALSGVGGEISLELEEYYTT